MSQKTALRKQAFTTCTLKDLCPEDKQKVAQLVKQVVELGKENQQLKASAATAVTAEEKLRQIQDCNKQAVKENCSLKNKLGQALTVLRMYHHKVQGLDAALRALQHANPADPVDSSQQQQAQALNPEQQQQQQQEGPSALQLPAPPAVGNGSTAKQQESPGKQATAQQVEPVPAGSNDTATAVSQQEAAPAQQPSPASSPAAAAMQLSSPAGGLNSGGAHAVAQQQQQQQQQHCLCSKLLCGGLQTSLGSNLALGLPLQQLQWALQDNSLFTEQMVSHPRTVLHFDASIGSRGAFVVQELPASTAAANSGSGQAAAGQQLSAQHSPQRHAASDVADTGSLPELQQQPREVSAGGAATAAAAAAASSALAAVKAAAAACAATPWQSDLGSYGAGSPAQQLPLQQAAAGQASWGLLASAQQGPADRSYSSAAWPTQQAAGQLRGFQEVPIVDMADAVHVLVQNEKSASSLHQAHARVTLAGGMGDGVASPEPPAPAAMAAAAAWANSSQGTWQQQQQQQDSADTWPSHDRQAADWQQEAVLQRFAGLPWQQGPQLQAKQRVSQQQPWLPQQQWQQQPQQRGAWAGPQSSKHTAPGRHQEGPGVAPCSDRTNTDWGHGHSAPRLVKGRASPLGAVAADVHALHSAGPGQHQGVGSDWRQQQQQCRHPERQIVGGQDPGTRQLLLKFDESLVDILAEVERLEQQQQQARQHLLQQQGLQQEQQAPRQAQQQQQTQQQRHLQPPQQQGYVVGSAAPSWQSHGWSAAPAAGSLAAATAPVGQQAYLDQKQAQLQQRMQQLQQEDMQSAAAGGHARFSSMAHPASRLAGHAGGARAQQQLSAGAWGLNGPNDYEADDVSDILNHLD